METQTKSILETGIESLSDEKRKKIAEYIHEASLYINAAQVELHGTLLQHHSLFDGKEHYSLWGQLYNLSKLFEPKEETL